MPTTIEIAAREAIDRALADAGWLVQAPDDVNLFSGRGVAVRDASLAGDQGRADYLLFVSGSAAGIVEVHAGAPSLEGVEPRSEQYAKGLPAGLPAHIRPLPFLYLATGTAIALTCLLDPAPRSRQVPGFLRPEQLQELLNGALGFRP